MEPYPIVRVEIERLRQSVSSMLVSSNKEINDLIIKSIDQQLTKEWILHEIDSAVKKCLQEAISDVAHNYRVKSAITDLVSNTVAEKINGK